jgi:hypothetical protein
MANWLQIQDEKLLDISKAWPLLGQRDAKQLTVYGLAYLKELHEGRDPRFTGC